MNIVPYTAIIGEKDATRTDIKVFSEYDKFKEDVMNAKIYKIMPHKFLDCDISIWVDGNIFLKKPVEELVDEWLGDADIALFKHPHRESIQWEMKWIEFQFRNNKQSPILKGAQEQIAHYNKQGFPRKTGVFNCGVIVRRHNSRVKEFNERWWSEITRWSPRDQLSFPVIKQEMPEVKINPIIGEIRNHPYLEYKSHKIPS